MKRFTFPEPEELSPPIIRLENGVVGYDDKPVLSRLDLRIDQDDRIALLGRNGEGKSTLSKLLSDRLPPMQGRKTQSSKLRVGYFAQHQVDELMSMRRPSIISGVCAPMNRRLSCVRGLAGLGSVPNRPKRLWASFPVARRRG